MRVSLREMMLLVELDGITGSATAGDVAGQDK